MRERLCKLAVVAVLVTGLANAQQVDDRSPGRAQQKPVTPGQTNQSQQLPSGAPAVSGEASVPHSNMDAADLQIQIQQAFQQDPGLANDNLGAYVSTDAVSLAGTVAKKADKERAQAIAESMAKGRAVINDIEVDSSPNYIGRGAPDSSPDMSTSPGSSDSTSGDTFALPAGTAAPSGTNGSGTSDSKTSSHQKNEPPQ